jgi:hypothetical protein
MHAGTLASACARGTLRPPGRLSKRPKRDAVSLPLVWIRPYALAGDASVALIGSRPTRAGTSVPRSEEEKRWRHAAGVPAAALPATLPLTGGRRWQRRAPRLSRCSPLWWRSSAPSRGVAPPPSRRQGHRRVPSSCLIRGRGSPLSCRKAWHSRRNSGRKVLS